MSILILSLCIVALILQNCQGLKLILLLHLLQHLCWQGLTLGVPVDKLADTIQKGFGDMLLGLLR